MQKLVKPFLWLALLVISAILVAAISTSDIPVKTFDNALLEKYRNAARAWFDNHIDERVYLATDKTLYSPGEDIWFTVFARDERSLTPTSLSGIVRVELINPQGNTQKKVKLVLKDGQAAGDFHLELEDPGGLYKIKAYTNWQKNDERSLLFEKSIQVQKVIIPKLKMKLDFEKSAYGPGDEVKANIAIERDDNQPLAFQYFDYLVAVEGGENLRLKGQTDRYGKAELIFTIDASLSGSKGLLNVIVPYEGTKESISRSIPIVLNRLTVKFYPEGGELLSDFENNMAFAALNDLGKGADVSGEILDNKEHVVARFSSYHKGMGAFKFKPIHGIIYKARITNPKGIDGLFELPRSISNGLGLMVKSTDHQLKAWISSPFDQEVSLIAMLRGKVYWSGAYKASKGVSEVVIPNDEIPMGVVKLTVIDGQGVAQAERLIFNGYDDQLSIDITTDKETYRPGEQVKVSVSTTGADNKPVKSKLAISVVDDQLLSFADDKSGGILTKLFLEPDLMGEIEEPAFYFNPEEPQAEKALDYLLLTKGWRKFEWKRILSGPPIPKTHFVEKATVTGTVLDEYTSKPIGSATVKLAGTDLFQLTDKEGKFDFGQIDLLEYDKVEVTAEGYQADDFDLSSYGHQQFFLVSDDMPRNRNFAVMARAQKGVAVRDEWRENVVFKAMEIMDEEIVEEFDDGPIEELEVPVPVVKQEEDEPKVPKGVDVLNAEDLMNIQVVEGNKVDKKKRLDEEGFLLYRARTFEGPKGSDGLGLEFTERHDFRTTVYWNGLVETGTDGKTEFTFYNNHKVGSFGITVEGISNDGVAGREKTSFATKLPFNLQLKIPSQVVMEDVVKSSVVVKNNEAAIIKGTLDIELGKGLDLLVASQLDVQVSPGAFTAVPIPFKALNTSGNSWIKLTLTTALGKDVIHKEIEVLKKGFPVNLSMNGQDLEHTHQVFVNDPVDGSLEGEVTAYPTILADVIEGLEGLLQEPYGCFEQASSTTYPNILVLQYLKETNGSNPKIESKALTLIDKGYKRLTTYETEEKGYEWFGATPSHEALTAYGLMEFSDMGKVYGKVDPGMVKRTTEYLMDRKDGRGGFKRSSQALDAFGRAPEEVTNAYILWALTESGERSLKEEFESISKKATKQKDAYSLALVANSAFNMELNTQGEKLLRLLISLQSEEGEFIANEGTITMSGGVAMKVEATALAILAMLKSDNIDEKALTKSVKYLMSTRSNGSFGSTQSTVLALKALIAYSRYSKKTKTSGTLVVFVNGQKAGVVNYEEGQQGSVKVRGLESFLVAGNNEIEVKFIGTDEPLPHTLDLNWATSAPQRAKESTVDFSSKLAASSVTLGETIQLKARVTNRAKTGCPMTLMKLGVPAGTLPQPWQLKELQESGAIDFYEVSGNYVICYFRSLGPGAEKVVTLDLKTEVPGEYGLPASSAYLYYTSEFKTWSAPSSLKILP